MKLLHIDSSILGEGSASRTLTRAIVERWNAAVPALEVTYRDLAAHPLPHFSPAAVARADELEAARNEAVLQEFLANDVLVVGVPLYNFSVPSQMKAWIDRIAVAGRTFRYTKDGPEGLAGGKRVILAVSRGGVYAPQAHAEFAETYLKHLFGFLGIRAISVVRAEGLGLSPEHRETALRDALGALPGPESLAA